MTSKCGKNKKIGREDAAIFENRLLSSEADKDLQKYQFIVKTDKE